MKTLLFIYNTHAGKGLVGVHLANILANLCAKWRVTVHPTRGAGDATAITKEIGENFDRIVCSGGDGTLHEVVEGLLALPIEKRPPVGYIPGGTTNDFAQNLNLPRTMRKMAVVAAAGTPRPVDIGRFNDDTFVYVAAFGAFTDVAYNTPQQFKSVFGHLAYVLEGAARIGSIRAYYMRVEHDNGVEEGEFIYGMVSNTVSVGGFKTVNADQVRLDDGLFEVVLVRKPTNAQQLQAIVRGLIQTNPEACGDAVLSLRTSHLDINCVNPLPWTLDGEYGGDHKAAHIKNQSQAVTIVYGG